MSRSIMDTAELSSLSARLYQVSSCSLNSSLEMNLIIRVEVRVDPNVDGLIDEQTDEQTRTDDWAENQILI